MSVELQPTEHPYIGVQGQLRIPIIRGTRVTVHLIADYYRRNLAVEEIERKHPELSLAAIHDAISYYLDHQTEIDNGVVAEAIVESQRIEARNDAAGSWISGDKVREQMVRRGELVG